MLPSFFRRTQANAREVGALDYESASRTHTGSRDLNEDRFLERPDLGLWAVADGMGGHFGGANAAQCIIDIIAAEGPRTAADVDHAVRRANSELYLGNRESITGSTVVVLRIDGMRFDVQWAGDSELWLLRSDRPRKLTRDHSVVEELIRSGVVGESERATHPQRHVITRAIGASESISLDRLDGQIIPGDVFVLCSDGLTKASPPESWVESISGKPLAVAADDMIARSAAQPGSDNITLILVRVQ